MTNKVECTSILMGSNALKPKEPEFLPGELLHQWVEAHYEGDGKASNWSLPTSPLYLSIKLALEVGKQQREGGQWGLVLG